ncbi:MAG TPA: globin family protein [Xanthobacteraceae bacterium]|nr:globin family protein [Xanthobacteraceae bacterium]
MNPDQIAVLRTSFQQVMPIADQAAALFYGRLFETAPEVRSLFKSPIPEQGRKLMATLAAVVNGLDDMANLLPAVQALGRRHAGYGVTATHFAPVGAALLWTLSQGLGEAYTPEVEAAWVDAYGVLSEVMLAAASPAAPPAVVPDPA